MRKIMASVLPIALFALSTGSYAEVVPQAGAIPTNKAHVASFDKTFLGEEGATLLNQIIKSSALYQLLTSLHATTPEIANSAQFTMMANEAHELNNKLGLVLTELQKTNNLIERAFFNGRDENEEGGTEQFIDSDSN